MLWEHGIFEQDFVSLWLRLSSQEVPKEEEALVQQYFASCVAGCTVYCSTENEERRRSERGRDN